MKTIIICGISITITFAIIVFDFGRRIYDCRELNDKLTTRLSDINEHYWIFRRNP